MERIFQVGWDRKRARKKLGRKCKPIEKKSETNKKNLYRDVFEQNSKKMPKISSSSLYVFSSPFAVVSRFLQWISSKIFSQFLFGILFRYLISTRISHYSLVLNGLFPVPFKIFPPVPSSLLTRSFL